MADDALEYPGPEGSPDWAALYLYRGSEVVRARPVFTGDVFFDVEVQGVGAIERKDVLVIQHPCALRSNGIDLTDSFMVAEVVSSELLVQSQWRGNYRLMPLPELVRGDQPHYAGSFTSPYLVIPDSLDLSKRVACMNPLGVNLLLQRSVYHNSRAVVPTWKFDDAVSAQYEEADGIEEWCSIREPQGISVAAATTEAATWLSDDGGGGIGRRVQLENRQYRSNIRKAMRRYVKGLGA
jgi:hypothetical protein